MAFRYFVICFLLVACAQVKSLEGGPVDKKAPVPLAIVPPNQTINFSGRAIAISFDEYIKLNNPNQTITIIPNDVKIQSVLKEKTLMLYWEEDLRENTTYSIYLNKTVRDVSESNDSIMQVVFSTGSFIDSLTYSTFIVDAKDASPKNGVSVGLFEHIDSLKPIYLTQTDNMGKATFNYLKDGEYYVRAFEDLSKQGKIGKNDAIAFKDLPIRPDTNLVDSLAMRFFSPLAKPDVTTFTFNAPSTFTVGANRSLENAKITLNDELISQNQIKFIEKDSLLILKKVGDENSVVLTVTTEEWTDTVKTRIPIIRNKIQRISTVSTDFFTNKPIIFTVPDIIQGIDTSKIKISQLTDSVVIKNYTFEVVNGNELHLLIPDFLGEKVKVNFKTGSVSTTEGWTVSDFEQIITKRFDKEFGIINLSLTGYEEPIILEMIYKNKTVRKEFISENKKIQLTQLEPGEYTFKITLDKNNNGEWDTGNFLERIQPEEIHTFSTPTKVRANWEIDVELAPLKNIKE